VSDEADRTSAGRLFQSRRPAVANDRSPTVAHRDRRTSRRLEVDERRWQRRLVGRSSRVNYNVVKMSCWTAFWQHTHTLLCDAKIVFLCYVCYTPACFSAFHIFFLFMLLPCWRIKNNVSHLGASAILVWPEVDFNHSAPSADYTPACETLAQSVNGRLRYWFIDLSWPSFRGRSTRLFSQSWVDRACNTKFGKDVGQSLRLSNFVLALP